jgi:exodeoxyribonuclease-5
MILTKGQELAMAMVADLMAEEGAAQAAIAGYAGTGKTTMLKVIAEAHGTPQILAPTGKAALRVSEATGLGASTIHKWLYAPKENPETGDVVFTKKPMDQIAVPQSRLIIIDEASMVSEKILADITSTIEPLGLKLLVVGDPFQLPPVRKDADGHYSNASALDCIQGQRTTLTEITRQALDSPIIRASMMIRQGGMAAVEAVSEHMEIIRPEELVERFLSMDPKSRALIVHANKTRQRMNEDLRRALGYPDNVLVEGEPVLVMQNSNRAEVFNGEVKIFGGWDMEPGPQEVVRDRWKNNSMHMSFGLGYLDEQRVCLSPEEIFVRELGLGTGVVAKYARAYGFDHWDMDHRTFPGHVNANLGHALTAHRAQGSEWQDVLVYAESTVGMGNLYSFEGRRWMYTATTRSRKNLIVCRD